MTAPSPGVAVVASLASAASFGVASALQHAQTRQVARRGALDPALLASLARRPVWLLGGAADLLAVVLQAVALAYGPVSLVQPLLVAGLPVAVLLSCAIEHRRPLRAETGGVLLCTAGLAALTPLTATAGLAPPPGRGVATVAGVLLAVVVGALLLVARTGRSAPLLTGLAAGAVVGAGSVLLAVCADRVGDLGALLASWAPYATVAVGLLGLLLSQAAFQTGALGTPLAALSLAEPAVAVLLALTVLHEHLSATPVRAALGAVGAAAAVGGVLLLAAAPREISS